jgi:hypothetical protein
MMRVRLDLETLSTVTTPSVQDQAASWDEFLRGIALQHKHVTESVSKTYQQVDQRISRVEEMLRAQSAQLLSCKPVNWLKSDLFIIWVLPIHEDDYLEQVARTASHKCQLAVKL